MLTKKIDYFNLLHEQLIWRIVEDLKSAEKDYGIKGMTELALRLEKEVRNICIKESLGGLAMPETYIEYEIGEEYPYSDVKKGARKSIEWVLRKEKLIPKSSHVIIPVGADPYDQGFVEEDAAMPWRYVFGFEVFDKTGNRILAGGEATILGDIDQETKIAYLGEIVVTKFEKE